MTAYNETGLYNKYVRAQADEALQEHFITPEQHDAIFKAKQVGFYTPNFFVRIGLGILTFIIASFATSLVGLMTGAGHSFPFFLVFMGLVCYGAAELMISSKAHYNSGVDNMLVWMAAALIWSGISWGISSDGRDLSGIALSFVAFVLCSILAARFADMLLSIAGAVALLCFVFYVCQRGGGAAAYATPFVMMLASLALYFVSAKAMRSERLLLYRSCINCVNVVSLVALYAAGNYYLVRELNNAVGHVDFRPAAAPAMGWFFWMWTFVVPLVYISLGIRHRNIILIRTAVPLIAVAVLTFRYYYSVLPPEIAMLLSGAVLLIVSWSLISYLKIPRGGFTFNPESTPSSTPNIGNMVTKEIIDKAGGR